jgi:hypothetical protein
MRRAGEPRAHEVGGGVERLLGPGDRLAEGPVGSPVHVAGDIDTLAQGRPVRRDVGEVPAHDHVVGVALGGDGELGVLANDGQPVRCALSADRAHQGGTAIGVGQRRGDVVAVRARGDGPRRSNQNSDGRRDENSNGFLAVHGGSAARCAVAPKIGIGRRR